MEQTQPDQGQKSESKESLRPSILVVEDDKSIGDLLALGFRLFYINASIVPTVEEAKELIKSGKFSLVITDYMLPDGSGIDVVRASKELDASVPVILYTSYVVDEKFKAMMEREKFNGSISKSSGIPDLIDCINANLGQSY